MTRSRLNTALLTLFYGLILGASLPSIASAQTPAPAPSAQDAAPENNAKENAQDKTQEKPAHYATFRLLAEKKEVKAGEEIWLGIEQTLYPQWHSYWKNPGDSGAAPRHDWQLPENFSVSDIHWPSPKKIPYPPLLNYGYENRVVLLQKLSIPQDLPAGPIALSVDVEALVCKDICIPEFASLELTLNDADATKAETPEQNQDAAIIAQAQNLIPQTVNWKSHFRATNGHLSLQIEPADDFLSNYSQLNPVFIPADWGIMENAATPETGLEGQTLVIRQKLSGERKAEDLQTLSGLLAYTDQDGTYRAVEIAAQNDMTAPVAGDNAAPVPLRTEAAETTASMAAPDAPQTGNSEQDQVRRTGLVKALALALLGGLVLNLMPCVFPVLSLKALSLVKIAEKDRALARWHGLSYTAGVILSFLAIAIALIILQMGGAQIGWGFQLQNPVVIALLAYLLFVIGLNLGGFFEFSSRLGNTGNGLTQGGGLSHSFFTGVLATVVATPCTAPFMGVAIGYALLQSAPIALSIFAALGLGLALPYLALSFMPALQKILPRPGRWMDVFKQFLAFPMLGFAAWLVWILSQQAGSLAVLAVLVGMVLIAFGLWLWQHQPQKPALRRVVKILSLLSIAAAIVFLPLAVKTAPAGQNPTDLSGHGQTFSAPYTPQALQTALAGDAPVFVEMTAAWCITCKVNHATSINIESTKKVFTDQNVQYLIGDWTNQDKDITAFLRTFGRNGVPIYVFYGRPDPQTRQRPQPVVLPQILTPGIVHDTVQGNG